MIAHRTNRCNRSFILGQLSPPLPFLSCKALVFSVHLETDGSVLLCCQEATQAPQDRFMTPAVAGGADDDAAAGGRGGLGAERAMGGGGGASRHSDELEGGRLASEGTGGAAAAAG